MNSIAVQYDFFEDPRDSEISALRKKLHDVEASGNKVRRALFAKDAEKTKILLDLQERLSILESGICKGKYKIVEIEEFFN